MTPTFEEIVKIAERKGIKVLCRTVNTITGKTTLLVQMEVDGKLVNKEIALSEIL